MMATMLLLMAQGLHRLHVRCATSGKPACGQSYSEQEQHADAERERVVGLNAVEHRLDQSRKQNSCDYARDNSGACDPRTLAQYHAA